VISIILPARNERENVLAIIPEINGMLEGREHEIILIDDDSQDGTMRAVWSLNLPFVKAFCRRGKTGLGSAVGFGIQEARGDVVVVMDSDFNHQPKYIPVFLKLLEHHDCVCGSRFLKGGGMANRLHQALSRMFNRFVGRLTSGSLTDYSYGFFAVRKESLMRLNFNQIFWGHGDYGIRFLFYLEKAGASILEVPVINGQRRTGRPNRAYVRNFWRYMSEVVKLVAKEQVKFAR
jgi:dolichol-phosphate mannosyltransferase